MLEAHCSLLFVNASRLTAPESPFEWTSSVQRGRRLCSSRVAVQERFQLIAAADDKSANSSSSQKPKKEVGHGGSSSSVGQSPANGASVPRTEAKPSGFAAAADGAREAHSAEKPDQSADESVERTPARKTPARGQLQRQLTENLVRLADAAGKPIAALGGGARARLDAAIDEILKNTDPQQASKRRAVSVLKGAADTTWTWWRTQAIPRFIRPRLPEPLALRSDEAVAAGLHALFFVVFFALPGLFHGSPGTEKEALIKRRELESQTSRLEQRLSRPSDGTQAPEKKPRDQGTQMNGTRSAPKSFSTKGGVPSELSTRGSGREPSAAVPPRAPAPEPSTLSPRALGNVVAALRDALPAEQRDWISEASYDSLSAEPLIVVEVRPSTFFKSTPSDQIAFTTKLLDAAQKLGVNALRLVDGEGNTVASAGGRTVALSGTERRLQTEIRALRKELERAGAETAAARSETAAAREELAMAKETYAKERAELERNLQAIKAENVRLAADLQDAQRELEQQPEREALLARAEHAEEERQKYAVAVESLGEQVAEARSAQQKAEQEAAQARSKEAEAKEQLRSALNDIEAKLEGQRAQFAAEQQQLKAQHEKELAAAREEAQAEIRRLRDALAHAEQSKAEAVSQARSETQAEIEQLRKRLAEAAKERETAVAAAKQEAAQSMQALEKRLQEAAAEQQRQLAQLEKQSQEQIRALESQLEKAKSNTETAVREATARLEKETERLLQAKEQELVASRAAVASLEADSEKQMKRLRQESAKQIASLEKQISNERKTAEQLRKRLQTLEQRLRSRPGAPAESETPASSTATPATS
jgi:hypothetical protein